jgi:peptidoglycan hydrolase-like amidase
MMLALVTISVFGLFRPVELEVRPAHGSMLVVESNGRKRQLEGGDMALLTGPASVTGRDGGDAEFVLSVPRRIRREFHGRLVVRVDAGHLTAIVQMDRETAVASIVAAEGPADAPPEARKAQAVVTRSFLAAARGRHGGFDFCDTTHCQFLRELPAAGSPARRAQEDTRGLAVAYRGRVIAALYSADCGGHTRTLEEAGWRAGEYPYFSVECPVSGVVAGHRIGMCQVGAAEMARRGSTFREILAHYFPAVTIQEVDR